MVSMHQKRVMADSIRQVTAVIDRDMMGGEFPRVRREGWMIIIETIEYGEMVRIAEPVV